MTLRRFGLSKTVLLFVALLLGCDGALSAQNSGVELHANSKATAADIGLPMYPGASAYEEPNNDSAIDLGYSFGDSQFRLMAADYVTSDAADKVLAFYRKPLSHYGEVLECQNGKPVGALTTTRSGLTCADQKGGHVQVNGHNDANDHELRAGNPRQFRIVGIDKEQGNSTRFGLVYVQLPKDDKTK